MKKRGLKLLLVLVLVFALAVPMLGCGGEGRLQFELLECGAAYEVSRGSFRGEHVVIPKEHNGLPVTKVANGGFFRSPAGMPRRRRHTGRSLLSVEMPDSITHIGNAAFMNNYGLTNMRLPENLINVGRNAFARTGIWLSERLIPETLVQIEHGAFDGVRLHAGRLRIPRDTIYIGDYAFSELTSIIIPNRELHIGKDAFGTQLIAIFFEGTSQEQWDALNIETIHNRYSLEVPVFFFSENEPAEKGSFWRYIERIPQIWR